MAWLQLQPQPLLMALSLLAQPLLPSIASQPASQPALSPPWAQTGQGEQFPVFLPPALFNPRSSSQSL